jgi:hypothetical protein
VEAGSIVNLLTLFSFVSSRTSCALTLRAVLCTFKIVNPADFVEPSARVHHHSPNKEKHPAGDFFIGGG